MRVVHEPRVLTPGEMMALKKWGYDTDPHVLARSGLYAPISGGVLPSPVGPVRLQKSLAEDYPGPMGAAAGAYTTVGLTPTALGATTARIFPFFLDSTLAVAKIYLSTPGAQAGAWQIGIFDATGTQWFTATVTTVATITTVTPATSLKMTGGLNYYFALTNNNTASAVVAMVVSPAFGGTTFLPRWGTVAATAGAMPASLSLGGMTNTVGGFPVYTVLSAI